MSFSFRPRAAQKEYSYREEFLSACRIVDSRRAGRKIALCCGGGLHSEALARTLKILNIPFSLYFLDLWGLNAAGFEAGVAPLADELGVTATRVSLPRSALRVEAVEDFQAFGLEYPLYLALWQLFRRIPKEEFILTGDGHFDQHGPLFLGMGWAKDEHSVPIAASRVAHYLWARQERRPGEYYFYSSTPELIAATFTHPRFRIEAPCSHSRQIVAEEILGRPARKKENVWAGSPEENLYVRKWLQYRAHTDLGMHFWEMSSGCAAATHAIFRA